MIKTLKIDQLLGAYASGYFPMPDPKTDEIRWYFPEPRAILPLDGFHCSKSLNKKIRQGTFQRTVDKDFVAVMKGCAKRKETWINAEFVRAYSRLHLMGFAHSVEIWRGEKLVGGVYGVAIGSAFFAESKFHLETDASKVALYYLVEELNQKGFSLLEIQFLTPHLESLGAKEISSKKYLALLKKAISEPQKWGDFSLTFEENKET